MARKLIFTLGAARRVNVTRVVRILQIFGGCPPRSCVCHFSLFLHWKMCRPSGCMVQENRKMPNDAPRRPAAKNLQNP